MVCFSLHYFWIELKKVNAGSGGGVFDAPKIFSVGGQGSFRHFQII